jgi:hypothetical protein
MMQGVRIFLVHEACGTVMQSFYWNPTPVALEEKTQSQDVKGGGYKRMTRKQRQKRDMEIRALHKKEGLAYSVLSTLYGLNEATIARICKNGKDRYAFSRQ